MRKICAECEHWKMGNEWSCSSESKHGVLVETKGWCMLKPNKRKRWNYHPACDNLKKRKKRGFFYEGGNKPIEEDLDNIFGLMEEILED